MQALCAVLIKLERTRQYIPVSVKVFHCLDALSCFFITDLTGTYWPGKLHTTLQVVFSSVCAVIKGFYLCNNNFLEKEAVARPLIREGFFKMAVFLKP